ncbi:Hypothetical predicted protein [Marmota monax]|uniref:Uncharacterized protein n=1 Tax=Marmota monax TaxID=9995 RepID=A0A5E4AI79_MARMO|nr:hypothetical protein GHT09_005081 [Marmota monax]VTJ56501.1 Hypothetical predicted protein [Marmota monax]
MILTVGNVTCWLFGTEDKNTRDKGYKWRLSSCLIIGGHESPEDSELLLVRISGEASCSGMRIPEINYFKLNFTNERHEVNN